MEWYLFKHRDSFTYTTFRLLYSREKSPDTHWIRILVECRGVLNAVVEKGKFLSGHESNIGHLTHPE